MANIGVLVSRIDAAVARVSKSDLTELKAFLNPPVAVKKALEAVHILKTGQKAADWAEIKKSLANPNIYLKELAELNENRDNIPKANFKKLAPYV